MSSFLIGVTYLIGGLTIMAQIGLVFFIVATIQSKQLREWLHERVGKHGVLLMLTLVGGSIVGSLFFSNVAGFSACFLCWIQRALMYPQIMLFGWYLYKPRRSLLDVALVMTILGLIVSGYHIILENGGAELIPCTAVLSLTASCTTKYVNIFGYVTIPVMSFTVFAALLSTLIVVLHRKHWLPSRQVKALQQP